MYLRSRGSGQPRGHGHEPPGALRGGASACEATLAQWRYFDASGARRWFSLARRRMAPWKPP